jgi:aminoglycoside phosphotransferase family enzyme
MYKGVVKIVRLNESDQCGNNDNNDFKVQIVGLRQKAVALDYAVKMRQISQRFRMDNLVAANKVELKTIEKLAHILVEFHHFTPTNITIKYFGSPKYIRKKVLENFETLRKLYDHSKNSNDDDDNDNAITISKLENKLISFIAGNKSLFNKRISENKVRDIHGDLYMKNIFIPQKNTVYLYDRIEFNDYLRYADVAEDVAHLCMDMDYHRISKLKKHFLSCYINESNDFELKLVLPFLMCYKACVRAKVSAFKARNERNTKVKARCLREARDHLELAQSYHELF